MPAIFEKLGVRFVYPEKWAVDLSDSQAGQRTVTLQSPNGAFWTLAIQDRSFTPNELADVALQAMREEYEGLETEPVEEQIGSRDLVGYDLNFFYLDLTNSAWLRSFRTPAASYLVFGQAEDREFDRAVEVFRAITASLRDGSDALVPRC